jgi:hypothetical protein
MQYDCYVTKEMQQTHCYTTGTITSLWKCNITHCYTTRTVTLLWKCHQGLIYHNIILCPPNCCHYCYLCWLKYPQIQTRFFYLNYSSSFLDQGNHLIIFRINSKRVDISEYLVGHGTGGGGSAQFEASAYIGRCNTDRRVSSEI